MEQRTGIPVYLHHLAKYMGNRAKRGSIGTKLGRQFLDHCRPFALERAIGRGPPGPCVPVACISDVALLAMQVRMDPGALACRVGLRDLVRLFPVAIRIVPKGQKRRTHPVWGLGLGAGCGFPEFFGCHLGGFLERRAGVKSASPSWRAGEVPKAACAWGLKNAGEARGPVLDVIPKSAGSETGPRAHRIYPANV